MLLLMGTAILLLLMEEIQFCPSSPFTQEGGLYQKTCRLWVMLMMVKDGDDSHQPVYIVRPNFNVSSPCSRPVQAWKAGDGNKLNGHMLLSKHSLNTHSRCLTRHINLASQCCYWQKNSSLEKREKWIFCPSAPIHRERFSLLPLFVEH